MQKLNNYLTGVSKELRKVSFPSRTEVWEMTTLVISVSLLLSLTIGLLDFAFRNIIRWLVA